MSHRFLAPTAALTAVLLVLLLDEAPVAAQTAAGTTNRTAGAAKNGVPSRTPWGDPDLEGVYMASTETPLERPRDLAGKATYTEAELAELERKAAARNYIPERYAAGADRTGPSGGYSGYWFAGEMGKQSGRTSLIIDPEDGRMPPLTPQAQKLLEEQTAAVQARLGGPRTLGNAGAEDLTLYHRCIARPFPRTGGLYNNGVQILQAPGYVALRYESLNEVRIIPLDGRPHLDSSIRQWNGNSRGRWEGNALVVEGTNFTDKQMYGLGRIDLPQGNLRVVERFTRVDATTINYQVTVDDPAIWTRPWTFAVPWRTDDPLYQSPEDIYEYACHEGNFRMMENTIKGARAQATQTQ